MLRKILLAWCVLSACVALGVAAELGPEDHGNGNLTLNNGDVIYGEHTNVNTLTLNSGSTVTVKPYDIAVTGSGYVEIRAKNIVISGTLNATAAGHEGGSGGGGGGGSAVGLMQDFGGSRGYSGSVSRDGTKGSNGSEGSDGANRPGGNGGSGGTGGGTYSGSGGLRGTGVTSQPGNSGAGGQLGGYMAAESNGDTTTDDSVVMGSGAGGGGGGAGGGTESYWGTGTDHAGGGGGGGGAGGAGGGYVKLIAMYSINLAGGIILTKGTIGGNGSNGTGPFDSGGLYLWGGDGGDGGATTPEGSGDGGDGGPGEFVFGPPLNGGDGGDGGGGAGGGIVVSCTATNGISMSGSTTLDARGGNNNTTNGGTIKILYDGTDPTGGGATLQGGRIFTGDPVEYTFAKYWTWY